MKSLNECLNLEGVYLQDMDLSKTEFFSGLLHLKKMSLINVKVNACDYSGSTRLKELLLNNVGVEDLSFFREENALKFLNLSRMKRLKNIAEVKNLSHLEYFTMQSMTNIEDVSPLSHIKTLKVLQLVDVGKVESLSFLKFAENLERFLFIGPKAKVNDLDFTWAGNLRKLKYVKISDRHGYSHKSSDFLND